MTQRENRNIINAVVNITLEGYSGNFYILKEGNKMAQAKKATTAKAADTKAAETKAVVKAAPAKEEPVKAAPAVKEVPKAASTKAEAPKAAAKTAAAKAVEKKATAKPAAKAATKTTATKTTAAKKAPAKKLKEAKISMFLEFNGKKVPAEEIVENVKATYKAEGGTKEIDTLEIYVKPEENAAYYVVNGELEGRKMDVYFC